MPSYKGHEWTDESYDAIEYLIDNDPIELASLYRQALAILSAIGKGYPYDHEGEFQALLKEARAHLKLTEGT